MCWLPPTRVKQSGAATIIGGQAPLAIMRSSLSCSASVSGSTLNRLPPVPVKPTSASNAGQRRDAAGSYPGGT